MKTKITFLIVIIFLTGLLTIKAQNNPTAREGATMVKIDTCYYLFGGKDVSAKKSNNKNYLQEQITVKQDNTRVHNNKSVKALFMDSTYMFDRSKNSWEDEDTIDNPPGRGHHAAATYNGKMYVFGGETSNGLSNDLWMFNPATKHWDNITVSGATISPRKNASMTIRNGVIYIAGGEDANGNVLTDAYTINVATGQTTQLSNMPGGSPTGNGAASVVLNNKIYYFGGYNIYGTSNSIMTYDPATSNWYLQVVNGFFVGFSGVVSINNMIAFVVGGSSTSKNVLSNEIYKFDASSGSKTLVSGNIPAGEYYNSVVFDFDTLSKSTNSIDTCLYFWTGSDLLRYQVENDLVQQFDTLNEIWTSPTAIATTNKTNPEISIYPNPAKDYIQINTDNLNIETCEIVDINGKTIKHQTINTSKFKIKIADLPKGIYFLKFNTNNGIITKRIVKN